MNSNCFKNNSMETKDKAKTLLSLSTFTLPTTRKKYSENKYDLVKK